MEVQIVIQTLNRLNSSSNIYKYRHNLAPNIKTTKKTLKPSHKFSKKRVLDKSSGRRQRKNLNLQMSLFKRSIGLL